MKELKEASKVEAMLHRIFGKDQFKVNRFLTEDAGKPAGIWEGFLSHKVSRLTLDKKIKKAKKDTWLIKTMPLDHVFYEYLATQLMRYLTNNATPKARLHIMGNNIEIAVKYLPDSSDFPETVTPSEIISVDQHTYFKHLALSFLLCDDDPKVANWVPYNMSHDVKISRIDFGNSFNFDPSKSYRHYYPNLHSFLEWFLDRMLISRHFIDPKALTDPLFIKALKSLAKIDMEIVRRVLIKSAKNFYASCKAIESPISCNSLKSNLSMINMNLETFPDQTNLSKDDLIKIVDQITNKIEQNRADLANLSRLLDLSHRYCNDAKYDVRQFVDQVKDILKHLPESEHGQYLRFAYLMFLTPDQKLRFAMALTIIDMDNIMASNNYVEKIYADIYFRFTQHDADLTAEQLKLDTKNKCFAYNKLPLSIDKIRATSYSVFMDPECRSIVKYIVTCLTTMSEHDDFKELVHKYKESLNNILFTPQNYLPHSDLSPSQGIKEKLNLELQGLRTNMINLVFNNPTIYPEVLKEISRSPEFNDAKAAHEEQSNQCSAFLPSNTVYGQLLPSSRVSSAPLTISIRALSAAVCNEMKEQEPDSSLFPEQSSFVGRVVHTSVPPTINIRALSAAVCNEMKEQEPDSSLFPEQSSFVGKVVHKKHSRADIVAIEQSSFVGRVVHTSVPPTINIRALAEAACNELKEQDLDSPLFPEKSSFVGKVVHTKHARADTSDTERICSFVARILCCRARTEAGPQL